MTQAKGFVMRSSRPADGHPEVANLDDYRTAFRPEADSATDEVWAEIFAAANLFGALRDAGLTVHFDVDDPTLPPRVRVSDLEGNTVRELSPSVVCDPSVLESELLSSDD